MAKNDVVLRSAAELERKYNLASLFGLKKNVEITKQGIQQIQNELNSMLNALVINLKDVLDSQSEISLWFYSGKPTVTNEPYILWSDPDEHIGDIYYDQSSGIVYQWDGLWEVNPSPDLVEAMAITNSEVDTSTDHERKVFFDTPVIPYSNGDWWVKEDGSLFICQISKIEGTYEENDFISTDSYTESVAEKVGDAIKVLKGTVTTLTENYAKFTDLATGGSTTIIGDNIASGTIKSNGYVSGSKGMAICLDDGTIDSPNLQLDKEGNLNIGGYLNTVNGLYTNLQFESGLGILGQGQNEYEGMYMYKGALNIEMSLPENFVIEEAKVKVTLFETYNTYLSSSYESAESYGQVSNICLYKSTGGGKYENAPIAAGIFGQADTTLEKIHSVFNGNSSYSATTTSYSEFETVDIKDSLNEKNMTLTLQTEDDLYSIDSLAGITAAASRTQFAKAYLNITGYISKSKEG